MNSCSSFIAFISPVTKEKSKLPSSTAAEIVKMGQEMAEWLKNPANSTAAEVFV